MVTQKEADAFCFEAAFSRFGKGQSLAGVVIVDRKENGREEYIIAAVTRGKGVGGADWSHADAGDAMAGLVGVCKRRAMHSITGSNCACAGAGAGAGADAGGPAS